VNVLVVDPLTPSTIYAGMGSNGGGGVYKTTDGGLNWVGLNTGLINVNCRAGDGSNNSIDALRESQPEQLTGSRAV
jgi:photosystem II stability/assembly factor-like uncharacterized protein